jgi:hypothetical protein
MAQDEALKVPGLFPVKFTVVVPMDVVVFPLASFSVTVKRA